MKNCVYVLYCSNNRYYIGSSIDLDRRFQEHSDGHVKATRNIRPVEMVFSQSYPTAKEARKIEYWLKKLKNRRIVERIILEGVIEKKLTSS